MHILILFVLSVNSFFTPTNAYLRYKRNVTTEQPQIFKNIIDVDMKYEKSCLPILNFHSGTVIYSKNSLVKGAIAYFQCPPNFRLIGPTHQTCTSRGLWNPLKLPTCLPEMKCQSPPQIPNGEWVSSETPTFFEGSKVYYSCFNGYILMLGGDTGKSSLTCHYGKWVGSLPTCVESVYCSKPDDIHHGTWRTNKNWTESGYVINTVLKYSCNRHYKLEGESVLWCTSEKWWSHRAPRCIPQDFDSIYCQNPGKPDNGGCTCEGYDFPYCEPFTPGVKVTCKCHYRYELQGDKSVICLEDGTWSGQFPSCIRESSGTGPATSTSFHVSTLAIMVATACSLLGVLLFIVVVVIFRRHKPRRSSRLYPGSQAPPPYHRVHSNSISDQDRLALISSPDNMNHRIPLPTYEDAISNRARPRLSPFPGVCMINGSNDYNRLDYRPLPPVPVGIRGSIITPGVHSSMTMTNDHRTITNLHTVDPIVNNPIETYGSRDTVNVSMSDASTSVTVETYDSTASSNPSNASRRVNTGSLHSSSTCSIVTEDVPLLYASNSELHDESEDLKVEHIQ